MVNREVSILSNGPPVQFLMSASKLEECPSGNRSEYAVAGRSNVGKSSLINTLAFQKALARTSRTPGRTQLINYFDFGPFLLADLPGYGYAKVSKTQQAYWQRELSRYLAGRTQLQGVLFLMDSRHPLQDNDRQMAEFLMAYDLPTWIVLTKVDQLKQSELAKNTRFITQELGLTPFLFSSKSGRGRKELLQRLKGLSSAHQPNEPVAPDDTESD